MHHDKSIEKRGASRDTADTPSPCKAHKHWRAGERLFSRIHRCDDRSSSLAMLFIASASDVKSIEKHDDESMMIERAMQKIFARVMMEVVQS